ncbi:tetratricopeptide repeat protein [Kitasatospora indigofera]|uniref:tetratricopeptide repeat protein n=1 Tax=Kitasatospora indigofera TaxID=67307 RepID=UPI00167D3EE2|nr:tetratricopeptide repeat protein [Kitasatospora indigofera]
MAGSTVLGAVYQIAQVGGDVTIVTDETRAAPAPYGVAAFPSGRPGLTVEQARHQPARLLQARHALVPFTGRRKELDRLTAWRDAPGDASVLLLHGTGGQGKTRLAAQFAAAARAAGWDVLQARHTSDPAPLRAAPAGPAAAVGTGTTGPGPTADGAAGQDAAGQGGAGTGTSGTGASGTGASGTGPGVLLIADYAERWPATDLLTLLTHSTAQGRPARVLLVARPAGPWWQTLANRLDRLGLDAGELALPPLTDDPDSGPAALFEAARDAFATALDVSGAHQAPVPDALADPGRFGQVLAVHMAALATVDAHRTRHSTDFLESTERISAYLLDRERDHWEYLHQNRRVTATPETLSRTAYTAALTGALDHSAGRAALTAVRACPDGAADQALADHAVPYPPAGPHAGTVLEPLYPDRLAEDFLALSTPGHRHGWFRTDPWAATAPQALLLDAPPGAGGWARPALTVLIAAAADWPHLTATQLVPLLTARPELALRAGGAALGALAALEGLPPEVLEAVDAQLPEGRHADLDPGIAVLCARLTRHRLAATEEPAERARLHAALAVRHGNAGDHDRALAADEQALAVRRLLAAEDPGTHLADLAETLNNLSVRYGATGRRAEALTVIEQAVAIRRRLAAADPDTHLAGLADSLNNLSIRYGEAGRRAEGLAAVEEAVEIRTRLALTDPVAHGAALASAFNNLSVDYGDLGRRAEGLAAVERAVAIRRLLAAADPAGHEADLASSLNNLSVRYRGFGRRAEGLAAAEEAVRLLRRLAAANPAGHEGDLATALNTLSNCYGELDRAADGLAAAEEAVEIRRRRAAKNPTAHAADLAGTLNTLSVRYDAVGRRTEGLAAAEEAVTLLRPSAAANTVAHETALTTALHNLSTGYGALGRTTEAVAAAAEAVLVRRRLAALHPAVHPAELIVSLRNLSVWCAKAGRPAESLAAAEEAVALLRPSAAADPTARAAGLAGALDTLSDRYDELGRTTEALAAAEETVGIRRRLAAGDPAAHEPSLASALNNLAVRYAGLGRSAEGTAAAEEAVALGRRLVGTNPAAHGLFLATALANLSDWYEAAGRPREGLAAVEEALEIHRGLAREHPAAHEPGLAEALWATALAREALGYDLPWVLRPAVEAVEILLRLDRSDPGVRPRPVDAVVEHTASLHAPSGAPEQARWLRGLPAGSGPSGRTGAVTAAE